MTECGFSTKIFGGFDKYQVLKYIESAHEQFDEVTQSLNDKFAECDQENKILAERVNQLFSENTNFKEQLQSASTEKSALLSEASEKDSIISDLKEQVSRASFKMQSMQIKCEKYDKISAQVAEILDEAKKMAATIVSTGKEQAVELVEDARVRSDKINRISDELSVKVSDEIITVTSDIKAIKSEIAVIAKQVDTKLADLELLLDKAQKKTTNKKKSEDESKDQKFEPSEALKEFF